MNGHQNSIKMRREAQAGRLTRPKCAAAGVLAGTRGRVNRPEETLQFVLNNHV